MMYVCEIHGSVEWVLNFLGDRECSVCMEKEKKYISEAILDGRLSRGILPISLNDLRDLVFKDAKAKGWHDDISKNIGIDHKYISEHMGEFISNLHGEVSELWEAYRKNHLYDPCDKAQQMKDNNIEPLTCAAEELADILVRTLETCSILGIDVEKAVLNKMLFNRTRQHRHGGKLC